MKAFNEMEAVVSCRHAADSDLLLNESFIKILWKLKET